MLFCAFKSTFSSNIICILKFVNSCKFVKIEIYSKNSKANWPCKITDYVSIIKNSNLWNKLLWYILFCLCNIATVSLSRASSKIKRVLGTFWKLFVCPHAWIFPLILVWSTTCTQKIFFFFLIQYFADLFSYKTLKKIYKFSTTYGTQILNIKLGEGKEKSF